MHKKYSMTNRINKLISHRGNINGVKPEKENRPSYIDAALQLGYDVEVDIRYIDGKFFLGHDTPDYEVSGVWILKRKDNLWFHCKDLMSAQFLNELDPTIIKFCHYSDEFVFTSNNKIWVHNLDLTLDRNCVIPLLSLSDINNFEINKINVYAICTDYPTILS